MHGLQQLSHLKWSISVGSMLPIHFYATFEIYIYMLVYAFHEEKLKLAKDIEDILYKQVNCHHLFLLSQKYIKEYCTCHTKSP